MEKHISHDMKNEQESNKGVVVLKMRRTYNGESHYIDLVGSKVPLCCAFTSSPHHFVQCLKLDGMICKCFSFASSLEKSLQRYNLNFKSSGPPIRIMYCQNGVWTDLHQNIVTMIKKKIKKENAIMEVNINGDFLLIDFLHMIQMNLGTGVQQPIAWVDQAGTCYFPEWFTNCEDFDDYNNYEYGSNNDNLMTEHHMLNDLKQELGIETIGIDIFNLKESSGESSGDSNDIDAHGRISNNSGKLEEDISFVQDNAHVVEGFKESKKMVEDVRQEIASKKQCFDIDSVKKIFSKGVGLHCGSFRFEGCCEETKGKPHSHLISHPVMVPKSPWVYFHVLLNVISRKVSTKDMQLVNFHFRLFQNNLISRGNFIMRLRIIVGDTLLKSTMSSLQNKIPDIII